LACAYEVDTIVNPFHYPLCAVAVSLDTDQLAESRMSLSARGAKTAAPVFWDHQATASQFNRLDSFDAATATVMAGGQ
jgi:hypothetical protein